MDGKVKRSTPISFTGSRSNSGSSSPKIDLNKIGDFVFVTEATTRKEVRSHVTTRQHRRNKRASRKILSIQPSTATILASIRNQQKSRTIKTLLRKPTSSRPPPAIFSDSEKFFQAASNALTWSLCASPIDNSVRTTIVDLYSGLWHIGKNEIQLAIPVIERGFQSLHIALKSNASRTIVFMVALLAHIRDCCEFEYIPTILRADLYRLYSRYFYQLSLVTFGSTHPVTILTKLFLDTGTTSAFPRDVVLLQKTLVLFHDCAVSISGPVDNELAFHALGYALTFSGEKVAPNHPYNERRMADWDDRILELGRLSSNHEHFVRAQKYYAEYLLATGSYQQSVRVFEELYTSLCQKHHKTIEVGFSLASLILEQRSHNITINKNTPQILLKSYPMRVARAREILEMTVKLGMEFGPKKPVTFAAISELATFDREHGAVSEADKAMERAARLLEEFSLG